MQLDLNLLVALDVLLEERSVGAAAERLRLSQPAMSRTLGRIRQATGDEILVRSGRVMLPTPYAEQVRAEVHELVTRAQMVFAPAAGVDLAVLERTFTLQCNDIIATALVPGLTARVAVAAPGVSLRLLGEGDADLGGLRRGSVDLQFSDETSYPADVRSVTVATDRLAVIGRRDLREDPETVHGFAALPHVVISRRGRRHSVIDDLLAERGLTRRVALTVPTLAAALAGAAAGLVTVAPATLAGAQLGPDLRRWELPVPVPPVPAVLAWHRRHERDSAHRWLRAMVSDTLMAVAAPPGELPKAAICRRPPGTARRPRPERGRARGSRCRVPWPTRALCASRGAHFRGDSGYAARCFRRAGRAPHNSRASGAAQRRARH